MKNICHERSVSPAKSSGSGKRICIQPVHPYKPYKPYKPYRPHSPKKGCSPVKPQPRPCKPVYRKPVICPNGH